MDLRLVNAGANLLVKVYQVGLKMRTQEINFVQDIQDMGVPVWHRGKLLSPTNAQAQIQFLVVAADLAVSNQTKALTGV